LVETGFNEGNKDREIILMMRKAINDYKIESEKFLLKRGNGYKPY